MSAYYRKNYWIVDYHKTELNYYNVTISFADIDTDYDLEVLKYVGIFKNISDAESHVDAVARAIDAKFKEKPYYDIMDVLSDTLNFDYWNWYRSKYSNRKYLESKPYYMIYGKTGVKS